MKPRFSKMAFFVASSIAVLMLIPLLFIVFNSVKSYKEIMISFISLPTKLRLENYKAAWETTRYDVTFFNSLIVTTLSTAGIIMLSSMAAYAFARNDSLISKILFWTMTFSMLVPFQTIMLPLVRTVSVLKLHNKLEGMVLVYWGLSTAFPIFTYHGFIRSALPKDYEEAARIDGAGIFSVFYRIVFPLLKPVSASLAVLNTLWIWNDFLMPLLLIRRKNIFTIPLTMYNLWGMYDSVLFAYARPNCQGNRCRWG